jgi:hypothetical protein
MQRPTSALVFGILNLCFAAWGLLGIVSAAVLLLAQNQQNNPMLKILADNRAYAQIHHTALVVAGLLTIVLALAGVGLLMFKHWGRVLSILWGVCAIAMAIVNMASFWMYAFAPLMEMAQKAPRGSPQAMGAMVGAMGGIFGGLSGMLYPVLLLFFMMRPSFAAAFNAQPLDAEVMPGPEDPFGQR